MVSLAVSLGGTGSLIEHPASSVNAGVLMNEEGRKKGGVTDTLIRLRYVIVLKITIAKSVYIFTIMPCFTLCAVLD